MIRTFRKIIGRCKYLAQDRPGIAFAAKELCRDFAAPSLQSLERLKRLIRYLKGVPLLVYRFDVQGPADVLGVDVDTDVAGCKATRRSTSGGVAQTTPGRCRA